LQTKFELIKGEKGKQFLDLAAEINAYLEFGIQTIVESECNAINRHNDKTFIKNVLRELKARKINYEVSLIYGLPTQTVDTFQYNIDFLQSNGCENITAYPLMLLKGTELYEQKKLWKFVERKMGDFHLPTVVSSNTFSERDWLKMKEISDNILLPNDAQD
jgi:radical SAM superfamily enzyme